MPCPGDQLHLHWMAAVNCKPNSNGKLCRATGMQGSTGPQPYKLLGLTTPGTCSTKAGCYRQQPHSLCSRRAGKAVKAVLAGVRANCHLQLLQKALTHKPLLVQWRACGTTRMACGGLAELYPSGCIGAQPSVVQVQHKCPYTAHACACSVW